MAITYTPTTNFGAKDSLPTNDPDKVIKGSEFTTEFSAIQTAFSLAAPAASPTFTGDVTLSNGNVLFGDDNKAIFGDGSDLQIYHDGSNSYVADSGTGRLFLSSDGDGVNIVTSTGENLIRTDNDGQVRVYFDDSEKLRTNSTGIDVTGTVTADGLTVDGTATFNTGSGTTDNVVITGTDAGGSTAPDLVIYRNSASPVDGDNIGMVQFRGNNDAAGAVNYAAIYASINDASSTTEDGKLSFAVATANTEAPSAGTTFMTIDGGGDISFYEDTGTTAKFFWDASAESLGIGTTSPGRALDVQASSQQIIATFGTGNTTQARLSIADANTTTDYVGIGADTDDFTVFAGGSERIRVDDVGNVGIGTTTVNEKLVLGSADSGSNFLQITNSTTTAADNRGFYVGIDANENARIIQRENADMFFSTNNTEVMTLDASGNVGIGTTSPSESLETTGNIQIKYVGQNTDPSGARYLIFNNTDTTLVADQPLGGLSWVNNDASATAGEAAYVKAYAANNTGTSELRFGTGTQNGATERMRITDAGNVGIGTTSPSFATGTGLEIQRTTATATLRLEYTGSNAFELSSEQNTVTYNSVSSKPHVFEIGSAEKARIDASGNLQVGTTSISTDPGVQLFGAGNIFTHIAGTSGADSMRFYRNSVDVGSITTTGTTTTYNTSSDARLKENIADAESASELIDAIQVRQFDWKADGSHQRYGMVAQELLEVAPEAVFQGETEEDMMGVDYSKLVPMLVKEIQSLRARVAQLEGA